jgi:DNA-binding transcriptional regulator YiaG
MLQVMAVLLLGGNKTGRWNEWYRQAIPEAERLYETYLAELRKEGLAMKKFKDLEKKALADPERCARVAAYKANLLAEISLAEVRQARQLTQEELAASLHTTQSGVSRLEHQTDLYVSTLRKYVEAAGGKLEITAVFPDGRVAITRFESLDDAREQAFAGAELESC